LTVLEVAERAGRRDPAADDWDVPIAAVARHRGELKVLLRGDRQLYIRRAASDVALSGSFPARASCVSDEFGRRIMSTLV
jgi:hypothetical protein